jgi:hypothetical protein
VRNEKGAVLVLVLWVLVFLTLVGGFYAVEARIRSNLGQQAWDALQGREMIRSLLLVAGTRLAQPGTALEDGSEDVLFAVDGTTYTLDFEGQEVVFSLEDENGKLNLNKGSEPQIREVILGLLQDEDLEVADAIVDAILDWRDPDDLVRLHGAEDDVYEETIPAYKPANGPFKLVEELLLVHGVTQELFYGPLTWESENQEELGTNTWQGGFQDIFTVYNESGAVVNEYAPLPLRDILGAELTQGQSARGIVRVKARWGNRAYQVYCSAESGSQLQVRHWVESAVSGYSDSAWSENEKY